MASFGAVVIEGIPELHRKLDAQRWYQVLERVVPRSLTPVLSELKSAAPKGGTGKLSRGFDTRTKRIQQGLVQGVEVEVGARVPYGHLVESGHKIIARGPQRKGKVLTRAQRGALRTGLKQRRLEVLGRVQGVFFAGRTMERRLSQTVQLIEKLLVQEVSK